MSETWTSSALDGQRASFIARPEPAATILVAHDDHRVQALLHDLLDDPRGRVIEVADVGTALVLAQTLRPVLEQLRRDPRTRQTPVIMLTASEGSVEIIESALGDGAVDYIGRPASPAHVAGRVRGAIRRARRLPDLGNIRTDFIAMLVHDLRTPLTVIQGYLDLLEAGTSANPESPPRYLRNMLACCAQMTGLVDEILDLYKRDAGKFMGEARPVDLAALMAGVVGRFAPAASRRGIALEVSGAERPLRVLGDAGRLDQVLMNLLGNALKFTPEGGTVTSAIRPLDGEIEVSVADSGPGIPPAEIPLLFERFGQAEEGRRSRAAGTGLGLMICRRVLEAHGGRIWVESEPGRGARFVFRLVRLGDG